MKKKTKQCRQMDVREISFHTPTSNPLLVPWHLQRAFFNVKNPHLISFRIHLGLLRSSLSCRYLIEDLSSKQVLLMFHHLFCGLRKN